MTTKELVQSIGGVFSVLFIIGIGYGSYQFYFNKKPTTVVNNEYKNYTITGENATVNESPKREKQKVNGINLNYDVGDKSVIVGYTRLF